MSDGNFSGRHPVKISIEGGTPMGIAACEACGAMHNNTNIENNREHPIRNVPRGFTR